MRAALAACGLSLLALSGACLAQSAPAQGTAFDRSLLGGIWAESTDTTDACAMSNLHNTFELSADGKTLIFKLDRKWKIASGDTLERYSASVVRSTRQSLVIRYNADIGKLPPGYPVEWELAFVAPGVYRWRATEWPEGKVNNVVGVKCFQ